MKCTVCEQDNGDDGSWWWRGWHRFCQTLSGLSRNVAQLFEQAWGMGDSICSAPEHIWGNFRTAQSLSFAPFPPLPSGSLLSLPYKHWWVKQFLKVFWVDYKYPTKKSI